MNENLRNYLDDARVDDLLAIVASGRDTCVATNSVDGGAFYDVALAKLSELFSDPIKQAASWKERNQ